MTTKQFFTHPATIVVGSLLIITAVVLIYGYNRLGWFAGTNRQFCDDFSCEANEKKLSNPCRCVPADPSRQIQDVYYVRPTFTPQPTPTPNPDGGSPTGTAGVRG